MIIGRWAIWAACLVAGGAASVAAYASFKSAPASYPEFIVGAMTTMGLSKGRDYAMLLAFMAGFVALFAGLALIFRRLSTTATPAVLEDIHGRFILAALPAVAWCGTFVLARNHSTSLFWCSAVLVGAFTFAAGLAATRLQFRPRDWDRMTVPAIDGTVLLALAGMFAVLAVAMIGNRIAILDGPAPFKIPDALNGAATAAAVLGFAIGAIVLVRSRTERSVAALRNLIIGLQALLPGLFLALLPIPIGPVDRRFAYATPIEPGVWIFLGLLALLTWADLIRLWRKSVRDNLAPAAAVSSFSLIAILIYCRVPTPEPLPAPFDDYHFGEDLIPWWSWMQHALLPLWDFTPPRGLINYKWGLLAAMFGDQTAGGLLAMKPYLFAIVLAAVFFPLAGLIGKWRAFLLLTFAAMDERLADIDALMTAGLCILAVAWTRMTHTGWLVVWLAVGTLAVLLAPGQGGLLVIATVPGGLWRLCRAIQDERPRLLRAGGVVLAVAAFLALLTPIGKMVAGAVRYGAGQSAINGIANGYPWETTFASVANLHPWLFEMMRFSWIGAGAAAIVITAWLILRPREEKFGAPLFVGVTICILCVAYVFRAAGRIDPGWFGRPGWASIWALALLLPILLSLTLRGTRQLNALVIVLGLASLTATDYGTFGLHRVFERPFDKRPPVMDADMVDGAKIGIPNLGVVKLAPDHVKRLVGVKRQLDRLLAPEETFLDMTNRGAQYFYFDRVPPSDLSAYYNMITTDQQMRAVQELRRREVTVALIDADNLLLDGLQASLRTPLLYRYLLLHFVPVDLDGYGFMVRTDKLARTDAGTPDAPTPEALDILDHAFLRHHLHAIPYVWGRSASSLSNRMRDVAAIDDPKITALKNTVQEGNGTYQVTGEKPAVAIDLDAALRGRDAGLLRFEFMCSGKRPKATFTVRWSDDLRATLTFWGRNGVNIVPLDAAPRWLLAANVFRVVLEITEPDGCTAFTLRNVALAQRLEVDEMEAALGH